MPRIATWHIRDETYSKALALVNHHHSLPQQAHQCHRARRHPRTRGLPYHESDLRIEEHYTDAAGFTDHVFALFHLLGFRFAPRIRDLAGTRLYSIEKPSSYATLAPLIGGVANWKQITDHWDDILHLATSIKRGLVTASLMLRKLGAYPRQNGLAVALRELGKIERTAVAVPVHQQRRKPKASRRRLNRVVVDIVLWNTVYLKRAVAGIRQTVQVISDETLAHLSPLEWEHINLTGDN